MVKYVCIDLWQQKKDLSLDICRRCGCWCECRIHTVHVYVSDLNEEMKIPAAQVPQHQKPCWAVIFFIFINWPCLIITTSDFILDQMHHVASVLGKTSESCKSLYEARKNAKFTETFIYWMHHYLSVLLYLPQKLAIVNKENLIHYNFFSVVWLWKKKKKHHRHDDSNWTEIDSSGCCRFFFRYRIKHDDT